MLAAFLHAWDEAETRTFVSGSVLRAFRAVQGMTEEARAQGFLGAWEPTDAGRDLVARWQAEREQQIEARAKAAANTYDTAVAAPTDEADMRAWCAVVRAVDASRDGAP
jgi:hypothetical protein